MPKTFVSNTERRLMLLLMVLITCTYYLTLENKAIENYNKSVKYEQEQKRVLANNPTGKQSSPSFGIYCMTSTPYWVFPFGLQFFFNPLLCFLLRTASFRRYLVSLLFTGSTFIYFILWAVETFNAYQLAENYSISNTSFNEVILLDSTKYEFFLFIILGIFIILQSFILLRFTLEKFQAKISLK